MRKPEQALGYTTPKNSNRRSSSNASSSSRLSRYLHSRKIDFAPGFDIGTPVCLDAKDSCPIYKIFRQQSISILSPEHSRFSSFSSSIPATRPLPTQADRILDAPDIVDDYYLNLVSWSDINTLAVALRNKLYLWNANNGSVSQLLEYPNDIITSVSWMRGGRCLAVGDSSHSIKLFDINKLSEVRSISIHTDRVSALAWNGYVLSSGSRDASILHHDLRIDNYFVKYTSHEQEICGLKWNLEQTQLASGGNDNKLFIWDLSTSTPMHEFRDHKAAVKALAWCPWKTNLLASGGGSLDRQIKMWDTISGSCLGSFETGSQVCALEWNKHEKELLSAHGNPQNELSLWKYPEMQKITELHGHTGRILGMCQNPEGSNVVTAGADETLRFWSVFASSAMKESKRPRNSPVMSNGHR